MSNITNVLARAVTDSDFAAALVADPESTLRANGVAPTEQMIGALRRLDPSTLSRLAAAFGDNAAAAGG